MDNVQFEQGCTLFFSIMETVQLILSPLEARNAEQKYRVVKRSIDARQRTI